MTSGSDVGKVLSTVTHSAVLLIQFTSRPNVTHSAVLLIQFTSRPITNPSFSYLGKAYECQSAADLASNLNFGVFMFAVKPRGALECNLTGRCPFLRISTTRLGKRFAFQYPVSGFLDYRTI